MCKMHNKPLSYMTCLIRTYLPGLSVRLEPEDLKQQEERLDLMVMEQDVVVLQQAERRVGRM